jgi:hypothetical protein
VPGDEIVDPKPSTTMMNGVQRWCRITIIGPDGAELDRCVLDGRGAPDMATVEAVAALALWSGRLGGGIVLAEVSPALEALLGLAGLRVEVEGQPELGKEALGIEEVEEEDHSRDLPG